MNQDSNFRPIEKDINLAYYSSKISPLKKRDDYYIRKFDPPKLNEFIREDIDRRYKKNTDAMIAYTDNENSKNQTDKLNQLTYDDSLNKYSPIKKNNRNIISSLYDNKNPKVKEKNKEIDDFNKNQKKKEEDFQNLLNKARNYAHGDIENKENAKQNKDGKNQS